MNNTISELPMDGRFPLGLLFAAVMFSCLAIGIFWPKAVQHGAAQRLSKFKIACGIVTALLAMFMFAAVFDPRLIPAFLPPMLVAFVVLLSAGKALDWATRKPQPRE